MKKLDITNFKIISQVLKEINKSKLLLSILLVIEYLNSRNFIFLLDQTLKKPQ